MIQSHVATENESSYMNFFKEQWYVKKDGVVITQTLYEKHTNPLVVALPFSNTPLTWKF